VTPETEQRSAIGLIGSIRAFLEDVPAIRMPTALVSR